VLGKVILNRIGLAILLLLAPVAATAQNATEKFIVPPYPGATPWKPHIVARLLPQIAWVEWWPEDQPENEIRDILTTQVMKRGKIEPATFLTSMFARIANSCTGAIANGPKEKTENGFPVAYGQLYCTGQKGAGKDVDIFFKIIGGSDALYIIEREFRRPAEPGAQPGIRHFPGDQMAEIKADMDAKEIADRYLTQVRLCPSDQPCEPAPKPAEQEYPQPKP
jgi:hypothetical protein